ncbi:MAG: hypothetical protein HQK50_11215 [Oligoflexia bacterium]|nr:hypothetical protein [Oligoflexia bacterium]MBF0366133.1 hypothetical protein [Oligoflexia bacterium]
MVIFFDQSGSVNLYDSTLASKSWPLTIFKKATASHRIILAGFDDRIHIYIDLITDNSNTTQSVENTLSKKKAKGYTTDLERPFKYLTEKKNLETIHFVLLITDGIPDVFDKKLNFLSWRIREDRRYQDLLDQYFSLKASGESPGKIYDKVGSLFFKRNIAFIEARLPKLKSILGPKLIIWDISGNSDYLKRWSLLAGAQYLPLKINENNSPIQQLLQAVQSLGPQQNSGHSDYEQLLTDVVSAMASKTKDRQETPKIVPPSPSTLVKKSNHWPIGTLVTFMLLALTMIAYQRSHPTKNINIQEKISSKLIDRIKSILSLLLRKRVRGILQKALILKNRLLNTTTQLSSDKKIELIINVPKGVLEVYWVDENGHENKADALDISMHGIRFQNINFNANSITKIKCPKQQLLLKVTHSIIIKKNATEIVVLLEKFENNASDWMRWVELLTRVNNI